MYFSSLPGYTLVEHKKLIFDCPILRAQPWPSMNYQYHWVQLLASLQYLVYQATQVSLKGERSGYLKGGQKE